MYPVLILYICLNTVLTICVLILLYMCPHTPYICVLIQVLKKAQEAAERRAKAQLRRPQELSREVLICEHKPLYMRPHATLYVSSCYCMYVLILLYMCPHTTLHVCSCYYICVLMLLHVCPHTAICVLILLYMCPHTAIYVSSYCDICVLICASRQWKWERMLNLALTYADVC